MKTFNIKIKKILTKIIPLGLLIVGVSSCTVSQTSTRTNDGIYYDPTDEPAPEVANSGSFNQSGTSYESQPIRIGGKYFDDGGNAPERTYEDSPVYNDNRVVINTGQDKYFDEDYVEWGDEGRTEIRINNYYGSGFYSPYYNPYYGRFGLWGGSGLGFSFGWNAFYGYPFYPRFYGPSYGWRPFYYGYLNPYYGYGFPRYYNRYPLREVTRGRANSNGVNVSGRPAIQGGNIGRRATIESRNTRNGSVINSNNDRYSNENVRVRRRSSVNDGVQSPRQTQNRRSTNQYEPIRSNGRINRNSSTIHTRGSSNNNGSYNNRRMSSPSVQSPAVSRPSRSSGTTIMRRPSSK